ncbi:MAG: hypothetical protein ABEI27_00420 [Halobellus sp.]|uniref:hypothetical protein n=1 Tax=Halobellus sp. TaxID=1979212 RepID=UPI0035D4FE43
MIDEVDDAEETAPCDRCGMSIQADATRCPVCGYQPEGYSPRLMRVGEVVFTIVIVLSVLTLIGGVTRFTLWLPADAVAQAAIVTPYTAGISGFFLYYIRQKRATKPTDSDLFGRS